MSTLADFKYLFSIMNDGKLNSSLQKENNTNENDESGQKAKTMEKPPSKNGNNRNNKNDKKKTIKPLPPPTYVVNYYKSTIGFFSKIYGRNDFKWRVAIAIIVGLVMSFVSLLFIQNTGVYTSGTSGIFQGIARIVRIAMKNSNVNDGTVNLVYELMFYGLYLITNIPLFIFSYRKMGKRFTILSGIVVILSNVVPLIINQIPHFNEFFIFGDTHGEYYQNGYHDLYLLNFQTDQDKVFPMFLYVLFAGLINGSAYAMAVAVGGSTGGLDFISFFFAYKKRKQMGLILLIFNSLSILISVTLGSYIACGVATTNDWGFFNFLSINLISGIVYAIISITVLNHLFPKDKVVKIQVYCEDVMAIRNYLYSVNFNHSLTINTTTGGYSLQEKKNIEIICLYIEVPRIIRQLKEAQKNMMITVSLIKGIDGELSVEESLN